MKIEKTEYGGFYENYIRNSNENDLFDLLKINAGEVLLLMETLTEEEALYRYSEGKWSVKEVFGHMIDSERIFCFRSLALARGEASPLPGYDHNLYVKAGDFNRYSLDDLKSQYRAVRNATLFLFESFSADELLKTGVVNNVPFSVRALGYVIAGHEIHHLNILAENYLPGLT
jgi:hypothetical protein